MGDINAKTGSKVGSNVIGRLEDVSNVIKVKAIIDFLIGKQNAKWKV